MALPSMVLAQLNMGGGNPMGTVAFMGALFAIMYFVMIRPQQKQMKEQQNLLSSLKKGDRVVTQGGILGKVFSVADKIVTLELLGGTKVEVLKSSISARVANEEAAKADGSAEQKGEKS